MNPLTPVPADSPSISMSLPLGPLCVVPSMVRSPVMPGSVDVGLIVAGDAGDVEGNRVRAGGGVGVDDRLTKRTRAAVGGAVHDERAEEHAPLKVLKQPSEASTLLILLLRPTITRSASAHVQSPRIHFHYHTNSAIQSIRMPPAPILCKRSDSESLRFGTGRRACGRHYADSDAAMRTQFQREGQFDPWKWAIGMTQPLLVVCRAKSGKNTAADTESLTSLQRKGKMARSWGQAVTDGRPSAALRLSWSRGVRCTDNPLA